MFPVTILGMEWLVIVLLLVSAAFAMHSQEDEERIIGGNACTPHSQPWQAYITGKNHKNEEYFCGGTLIDPSWVVTAAHCHGRNLDVRLGKHNQHYWESGQQVRKVVRAIQYRDFNIHTLDNDIMLLKLERPVRMNRKIRPLRLPVRCSDAGTQCLVSGWGYVIPEKFYPNVLQCATIRIINWQRCKDFYYDRIFTKNMICASKPEMGMDACKGDSGGPLVCNRQLEGIVSFGKGCGRPDYPGVYTKVCNYVKWLHKVMRSN